MPSNRCAWTSAQVCSGISDDRQTAYALTIEAKLAGTLDAVTHKRGRPPPHQTLEALHSRNATLVDTRTGGRSAGGNACAGSSCRSTVHYWAPTCSWTVIRKPWGMDGYLAASVCSTGEIAGQRRADSTAERTACARTAAAHAKWQWWKCLMGEQCKTAYHLHVALHDIQRRHCTGEATTKVFSVQRAASSKT